MSSPRPPSVPRTSPLVPLLEFLPVGVIDHDRLTELHLNAPAVRPLMKYFWKIRKRITTGTAIIRLPAAASSYSPVRPPANRYRPEASIWFSDPCRYTSGSRKLFQV